MQHIEKAKQLGSDNYTNGIYSNPYGEEDPNRYWAYEVGWSHAEMLDNSPVKKCDDESNKFLQ
jgi:hypothetical protein